jgi:hypothetical protein
MQIFRVLGLVFIGLCVLMVIGTALPALALMGGGGFGGFGNLGVVAAVPAIVFTLLPLGIVFLALWSVFTKVLGPDASKVRGGLPSTATVRATQRTSMRVNGQPVLKVDLDVAVPGRGSVPVSVRRVVPPEHLAAVAVGATLPAVVDPHDPRRVAIDWARVGLAADPSVDLPGGLGDLSGLMATLDRAGIHLDPALLGGATSMTVDGPTTLELGPEGPAGGSAWATTGGWAPDGADPVPPSQLLGTEPASGVASGPVSATAFGAGPGVVSAVPGPSATGTPAYRSDANVDVTGQALVALRAAGMPGRGVIREAGDIGISIGDGRLFRLRLDVIPSEGLGYRLDHIALVPADARWRIVTGVTLPLFIDRSEPARLAIDWSA